MMRGSGSAKIAAEVPVWWYAGEARTSIGVVDFALIWAPGILWQCDAAHAAGRDAALPGVATVLIIGRGHA